MDTIKTDVAIIGAGLCGLSVAHHLQQAGHEQYLVLDREARVGGLSRTENWSGFSFDHSIHILYTKDAHVESLICDQLLADNLQKQTRRSYCYSHGVYTEYPYQANNYGLPADVIAENILGLIEATYADSSQPADFEQWIRQTFGDGIANNFMIPYNRRVWAWDLKEMNFDWIAERVPTPALSDVVYGALKPPAKQYGPNREFWYPKTGGIESLAKGFERLIPEDRLWLNTTVTAIDGKRQELTLADGRRISYRALVSSLPIPVLIKMLDKIAPSAVKAAAADLNNNVVHTVNVGLDGEELGAASEMDWIYFPEDTSIFHRMSFPGQFSPWMVPDGCCSLQVEISESKYREVNRDTLVQDTLQDVVSVGLLSEKEILPVEQGGRVRMSQVLTLDPAYIIYDLQHRQNIEVIRSFLESINIETRGRFGEWEYFNMDHSILSGKKAAERLRETPVRRVA